MKKMITILLALALLLSLTACSGAKKTPQQTSDMAADTD